MEPLESVKINYVLTGVSHISIKQRKKHSKNIKTVS